MKTLVWLRLKKFVPKFLIDFGYSLLSFGRAIFDRFPFLRSYYHFVLALIAALVYRFPSRKLKVTGITGTNGKTTTVELTEKILEEAGYKVATISSIKFKIGDKKQENLLRMTLPGRLKVQRFLRRAVNENCQYAILEVTSEGIKQHRLRFIDFDIAVLTNLTPEHIEAHGSFENYKRAKAELFKKTRNCHVINLDDENAEYFLKFPAKEKWGYRISEKRKAKSEKLQLKVQNLKIVEAEDCQVLPKGVSFSADGVNFNLKLLGKFNIYNALAAISIGLSQGIDLKTCKRVLEKVQGMPGRMEKVISEPFEVFVDYAFTPNALEKVYSTLTNLHKFITNHTNIREISGQIRGHSRLICVFGACGGGRDKWKRPELGKIAAEHCNRIILTNEDPYDEKPLKIIEDIESGFSQIPNHKFQTPKYEKILDRREAIGKALSLAEPGDVVIITGKGCEPSICLAGGKQIPWDDRGVVREEFEKLANIHKFGHKYHE